MFFLFWLEKIHKIISSFNLLAMFVHPLYYFKATLTTPVRQQSSHVKVSLVRILPYFSRDDGPRKFNWIGEGDDLKQKKQIKVKQFPFQAIASFLFRRSMNRIQFLFNKDLFLSIKRSRILLDQGDQLLIGLIKILQASNDQDHLIVKIRVVL